ncbi:MAG TPA: hypothetical protein VNM87_02820, partial [Candidatus Udaeobacter sp.]|nr:hypothetical protein [Candidatus Udaeobacter sp.]
NPTEPLTPKEAEYAAQFQRRFIDRSEVFADSSAPPFARDVMAVYRRYWTKSLMGELTTDQGEAFLTGELKPMLGGALPDSAVIDEMMKRLEAQHIHVLDGITRPYYDLMLWTRADTARYEVDLTDTKQQVTVIFIGDFLIKGWSHFATLGMASTGGWATKEALFCLRDDYDLDSENFKVSYLQHEGRHFADYTRFPELQQADLEYRGKLTELAFARESTYQLLEHFAASGAKNPDAPHTYANYAVVRDLSQAILGEATTDSTRLHTMPVDKIQGTARELLAENTRRLTAAGADTTRGIIVTP